MGAHPREASVFTGSVKMYPELISSKQAPVKQMSDSLASVHRRQNKQAIILAAKNEIAKSMRNKARCELVYTVTQWHKRAVSTGKSQSFMVLSELQWFVGPS